MKEKHQLLQCIFHKNRLLSVCIRFTRPVRTYKKPQKQTNKRMESWGFFKFIFIYFFIYFFVTLCIKALNPHTERCLFLSSVSHCAVQMT